MTGQHAAVSGNGAGEITRLREDIVHTREELGRTVEALAAKADVRARLRHGTSQAAERVRTSTRDAARDPVPWLVLFGAAALVVTLIIGRRRR